jgi:hypothetical protein
VMLQLICNCPCPMNGSGIRFEHPQLLIFASWPIGLDRKRSKCMQIFFGLQHAAFVKQPHLADWTIIMIIVIYLNRVGFIIALCWLNWIMFVFEGLYFKFRDWCNAFRVFWLIVVHKNRHPCGWLHIVNRT